MKYEVNEKQKKKQTIRLRISHTYITPCLFRHNFIKLPNGEDSSLELQGTAILSETLVQPQMWGLMPNTPYRENIGKHVFVIN